MSIIIRTYWCMCLTLLFYMFIRMFVFVFPIFKQRSRTVVSDEKHVQKKETTSRGKSSSNQDEKLSRRHTLSHADRKKRLASKSTLEVSHF